jgi:hypothetical protein
MQDIFLVITLFFRQALKFVRTEEAKRIPCTQESGAGRAEENVTKKAATADALYVKAPSG